MNIYKLSGLLLSIAILIFVYLAKDALNKKQDLEVKKNLGLTSLFSSLHIFILVYFFYQFALAFQLKLKVLGV